MHHLHKSQFFQVRFGIVHVYTLSELSAWVVVQNSNCTIIAKQNDEDEAPRIKQSQSESPTQLGIHKNQLQVCVATCVCHKTNVFDHSSITAREWKQVIGILSLFRSCSFTV